MSENKKLFLLDGMALIYRAYFAFSKSPRINSKGLNTSAMFGFTNTLLEVINKERPTHIAVSFDTDAPTERHESFADYKAHREAMPEDLSRSIPYIYRILEGFRIPIIIKEGYEADDIIGTLAKEAERQNFEVYMMTPDKDFGQLVSEHIFMYRPSSFGSGAEKLGIPEILQKFEIKEVSQVIDILGLWGDSADNIPGIPGVGEKTAKQLVAEYGSVENVIANAANIKGKLGERVREHADMALMSKKLATIITNVPVDFDEQSLQLEDPDKELLRDVFTELEFRALAKKVLEEELPLGAPSPTGQQDLFGTMEAQTTETNTEPQENSLNSIHNLVHQYTLCDTPEKRSELILTLGKCESFSFDTETTDIDANKAELVGLSFSINPHEGWYIPLPDNYDQAIAILHEFKPLFENTRIGKTGQNIKYDLMMLKWYETDLAIPSVSMPASTGIRGISTSSKSLVS
jgi:DNA polymerase-1